jgi:hypothetical protein
MWPSQNKRGKEFAEAKKEAVEQMTQWPPSF